MIPPQTLEAGVIKIQVVEGSLQEIKIVGNRRLSTNYIRDRIRLGAGKPLNVPHLLEKLQLLRLDPCIQNLSDELQTGARLGTSDRSKKMGCTFPSAIRRFEKNRAMLFREY